MSRIIKAGKARFVIPDSPHDEESEAHAGEDTQAQPEEPAEPDYDFQAAYDEVMAKAQSDAADLISRTREDARLILEDAEKQAEDIRQTGYEDGYKFGLQNVREETMEIIRKAEEDAAELIVKAQNEHADIIRDMEPKLLKLALEVAEKILHRELERDDSAYMSILSNALGAVKAESKVSLRVNPSDYVRYFNSRDNAKIRTPNGNVTAQVMIDSSVGAGGCMIETDSGAIDSSPEAQIGQIATSLGIGYGEEMAATKAH